MPLCLPVLGQIMDYILSYGISSHFVQLAQLTYMCNVNIFMGIFHSMELNTIHRKLPEVLSHLNGISREIDFMTGQMIVLYFL